MGGVCLVGGAIAYSSYRRGRVPLVSSIFKPLFGSRDTDGPLGKLIDALALIATLFGTAATLGVSAIQIGEGVTIISGHPVANAGLLVIIGILGCAFILSAVSGVSRGVRYLSNINTTLTLGFVIFVFIVGPPTLLLLNLIPSGIITYLDQLLPMMAKACPG